MKKSERKLTTGTVRASYVSVFASRVNELSGKEEYSLMILVPKSDKATIADIKRAIQAAESDKWHGKPPAKRRNPLRDGDSADDLPQGTTVGDEPYAGHYFMNLKSPEKPGVVDRALQPVIDADAFRSGDYCRVSMDAYAYETKGNKGVAFGLNNVQVIRKGESLGGKSRPENDFEALDDDEDTDFLAA